MRVFGLFVMLVGLVVCWQFIGPQANADDPQALAAPATRRDGGANRVDMTNTRPMQPLQ